MRLRSNIAISESGFIFNPATGESFTVNPIGIEILQMMKDDIPLNSIIKELVKKYSAEESTIEKDLYDFISMLRTYSLIEDVSKKS